MLFSYYRGDDLFFDHLISTPKYGFVAQRFERQSAPN